MTREVIRVLVLEDDDRVRELVALILTREGCAVHSFATVRGALASEEMFEVLILDRHLPNGDGIAVRDRWPLARVIVMSGKQGAADDVVEPFAFLPKPFRMKELVQLVKGEAP